MLRIITIFLLSIIPGLITGQCPKREFRGVWMHTIGQSQYFDQTTDQNKKYLCDQLDKLHQAGINAVFFQVRPSADSFYPSNYELWSKYLTKDGKAPSPYWDPLQFMIDECHKRGMELHAWLNPYRVTTTKNEVLPPGHIYHKHPERFVKYSGDGKIYFNPALEENRQHIANVVVDIVNRYDVDGIHFDDYFYPYPVKKHEFPDAKSYAKYGGGMDKGDWRRQNVDKLIELVHDKIRQSDRPWVRFGISPFGIWRNKRNDSRGSETNGLQNYDDLYADVILWAEKEWIDYLIPQLYWDLDHRVAPSLHLTDWWAQIVPPSCHLYIGQDVKRTMDKPDIGESGNPTQLDHKVGLTRKYVNIQGSCWWPGYEITTNYLGIADSLSSKHQATPALVPAYRHLSNRLPRQIRGLNIEGNQLVWYVEDQAGDVSDHVKYVVYYFPKGAVKDYDNPSNILDITPSGCVKISQPGTYAVTALDRVNNESLPVEIVKK